MNRTSKVTSTFAILLAVAVTARAGDAPRGIDAIENDLVSGDAAVRAKAAIELNGRFPDGAVAVPMLVDLLDDESPDVAAAAANAIESLAFASVAPLVKFCDDDARLNRKERFGQALELLLGREAPAALDPIDPAELEAGTSPPDVAALAALLPEDQAVRNPRPTLPMLVTLYGRAPAEARGLPAAALAQKGMDAVAMRRHPPKPGAARDAAAAAALPLLRSETEVRTWIGARLLTRIRPLDEASIAELVKAMTAAKQPYKARTGESIHVAPAAAAQALREIGAPAAAAAPALLDAAGKREPGGPSAEVCVQALLAMGREADVVALLDKKPPTSLDIALELAVEGRAAAKALPVIVTGISTSGVYGHTIRSLTALGHDATAAIPALRTVAAGPKFPIQRLAACDAILAVAPGDADALAIVDTLARQSNNQGSVTPLSVIADRTPVSPALVTRLSESLDAAAGTPGSFYEIRCVEGLARCGALAKETVPKIVSVLATEEKGVADPSSRTGSADRRRRIVAALGRMGPDATAAVPALTTLRDKGDETIRVTAAQALRRIQATK